MSDTPLTDALLRANAHGVNVTLADEKRYLIDHARQLEAKLDALLNHCPDAECMECGKIMCPHGEPLHFHHDGCPACDMPSGGWGGTTGTQVENFDQ